MSTPRVLIAGTNSGCGKTTVVCGLLAALKQAGLKAASCKCGPDYIDPMFHSQVFGIPSSNLDLFFSTREEARVILEENGKCADVTIVEGVMGAFDGMQMDSDKASSYDVAKQTQTPMILVVNAKGMALSVVPIIKGYLEFRKDHAIKGVILNNVSKMTGIRLKEVIEKELPVNVYGCIPALSEFKLSSRHLGLVTPFELEQIQTDLARLGTQMAEYLDLEGILALAKSAPPIHEKQPKEREEMLASKAGKGLRVGVAWDKAFCFYYKENLRMLELLGCELVYFSPLKDNALPEGIDAVLLGGGYPELYARDLSENESFLKDINQRLCNGLPCLAECGGFMYLHEQMEDDKGEVYKMAAVIPGKTANQKKLVRFGYTVLEANQENPYLKEGETIKAHEFHYWDSDNNGETFLSKKPSGKRSWVSGHGTDTILAGFAHLYYPSNWKVVRRFLEQCKAQKEKE
ncbi:cobyrinate a,c-diamide synthase [[Clostridium] polysaccharolyticum]|uniref:Cobyrinate a,c-diamide synthase n=1 Tax=[Clostridium] polysaccharolyticum TaxID=29364 RepID=A0A1H9Y4K3_9FIRM|nr:cobyrinate a,c-diamide synthase [[Clostridium] polysaccharolyticum]SES63761.1 cobyrinic acid a,c-diamide synthase [[Clostridium] polysaccharolyticum]